MIRTSTIDARLGSSLVLALALTASCGGGGGGGGTNAPSNLSFARVAALYTLDETITPNAASVNGQVANWSVTPALPAGLTLDPQSGALQGAPSTLAPLSDYVVRAQNSAGFAEVTLRLGVVRPNVQALVCSATDNTLESLVTGPADTRIATGFDLAPFGAAGPRTLAAHPSGRWAYVGQFTSRHLSRFELDASSGRARALDNVSTQGRPEEIALHPSGDALYLFSRQTPHLETFAVNPVDGALSSLTTLSLAANGLEAVARSADGRFMWATIVSTGNQSITTLEVDPVTLIPAVVGTPLSTTNKLRSLAVAPDGRTLYGASFESPTSTIDTFTVDPATGALQKLDSVSVGAFAVAVAVEPTGRFLYASISSDDTVRVFEIDPLDGRLSAPSNPQVAIAPTGARPAALAISADGEELFVTELDGFELGVFDIDPITGGLTRKDAHRTREQPQLLALVERDQAVSPSAPFVYVGNATSGDVSIFASAPSTGELTVVESGLPVGGQPATLACHPRGTWMYAADASNGVARAYAIDPATGELGPIGSPVGAGLQPSAAQVDPSGRFLYVANNGSSNVSVFAINPVNGFLSQSTVHNTAGAPTALEIDATGRFVVVAHEQSSTLEVFEVDPASGALVPLGAPVAFTGQPSALRMHASGRYLLATAGDTGELWAYSLAAVDGALSAIGSVNIGAGAQSIASDARGARLYVAVSGAGAGSVAFTSFDSSSGSFGAVAQASAGTSPADLEVDPSGAHLFVANNGSNDVTRMSLNPATGAPTSASSIAAGVGPRSIELLPRFD